MVDLPAPFIGHEQSPFARGAQAILKFLKEGPGYGLKSLRSETTIETNLSG